MTGESIINVPVTALAEGSYGYYPIERWQYRYLCRRGQNGGCNYHNDAYYYAPLRTLRRKNLYFKYCNIVIGGNNPLGVSIQEKT
jgi:filamentous hemagglutinin